MDVTRQDVDETLDALELHGAPPAQVELVRIYLNKTEEMLKTYRGEVPLFGRR